MEFYRKALGTWFGQPMEHAQYGMVIDRAWVEERLKTPFTRR